MTRQIIVDHIYLITSYLRYLIGLPLLPLPLRQRPTCLSLRIGISANPEKVNGTLVAAKPWHGSVGMLNNRTIS